MKNIFPKRPSEIISFFRDLVNKNPNHSKIIIFVFLLCFFPLILNIFGVDLGIPHNLNKALKLRGPSNDIETFNALMLMEKGSSIHTMLETICVLIAVFTVVFAFIAYEVKSDIITVVIGTTLFCAGMLDAFHILASDKLIWAPDLDDVINFTWLLSRILSALIILFASIIILYQSDFFEKIGAKSVYQVTWFFILITLLTIIIVFFNVNLLKTTTYPNAFFKRPIELVPLIIFMINGIIILPIFYKRNPSVFAFSLLISMIPAASTQMYILFSEYVFDNYFVVARILKAVSYVIPFVGIVADYVKTHRAERETYFKLENAQKEILRYQKELEHKVEELNRSNTELEQFAYIASHDLQEPLRKIQAFGDRLATKYSQSLQEEGRDYINRMKNAASRMQVLINDLLNFSRVKKTNQKFERIDLNDLVSIVLSDLEARIMQTGAVVNLLPLPTLPGDKRQLGQLFQNLISNALKFQKKNEEPVITISSRQLSQEEIKLYNIASEKKYFEISVKDNGIGFDNKYLDKIFTIFQRLHGRNEYEGTGIGLAICRKVVENHQGFITADSKLGEGTTFLIILPEDQ